MRCRGGAKRAIREVDVHICIVGPVEEVEELEPELEVHALRDVRIFVEIDVRLKEVRSAELHGFLVSPLPKSWNGEVALGNCSGKPGFVVGGLFVAQCIWVIQVVAVGVVVTTTRRVAYCRICLRGTWWSIVRRILTYRAIAVEILRR